MSKKAPETISKISAKEMKEAIVRSGYLLEQRIETVLSELGYFVETNPVFPDPATGKSREVDLRATSALRVYRKAHNFIYSVLLCECKNNPQPLVFFKQESPIAFLHHHEVKVSGMPVKFWDQDGYIGLSQFARMESFHHYCKRAFATQYCTFQLKKDKSSWMAFHSEEQHDMLSSLIKALEYEVANDFDDWVVPEKLEEETVNVIVYYPVVIMQGDLYWGSLRSGRLSLQKSKHIQLRKESFSTRTNEVETYQIDVISEEYLPSYLRLLDSEMGEVKKVFQRHRQKVFLSIDKIVQDAKRLKRKPKSYREYLEF